MASGIAGGCELWCASVATHSITHHDLRTSRLTLRVARCDDAESIFYEYAADPAVTRYLQWQPQQDIAGVRTFLSRCERLGLAGEELSWVIAETPAGAAIGMISLRLSSPFKAELGYVLARKHWGRGYMPEAVRAVTAFGLGTLACYRVSAYTDHENVQSARVMEKAGMQYEGRLRRYVIHPNLDNEPRDALLFAACR